MLSASFIALIIDKAAGAFTLVKAAPLEFGGFLIFLYSLYKLQDFHIHVNFDYTHAPPAILCLTEFVLFVAMY